MDAHVERLVEVAAAEDLDGGDLDKALNVRIHLYSRSAVEKIEAAGGKAELL